MSTTFPYTSPNNLDELSFIGGSFQELTFNIYDDSGNAVNLSGATLSWTLSYYSDPATVPVTKTPVSGSSTNQKRVNLAGADTLALSGKFIQQFRIIDSSGSSFIPSQGVVNIFPARS